MWGVRRNEGTHMLVEEVGVRGGVYEAFVLVDVEEGHC